MQTADGCVPDRDGGTCGQLQIRLEPDLQGVRVTLVGEVDLATAPELDRLLDELVESAHRRLLVDLRGVEFMDSSGLASLVRAVHAADANGRQLIVRSGPPQVQRLFELTGVGGRLTFEA